MATKLIRQGVHGYSFGFWGSFTKRNSLASVKHVACNHIRVSANRKSVNCSTCVALIIIIEISIDVAHMITCPY